MSRYPDHLTPTSTPSKLTKSQKSRTRREASGVFSLFQTPQIQQFKEAFSLIDQDGDGLISEQDLKGIFSSLGKLYSRLVFYKAIFCVQVWLRRSKRLAISSTIDLVLTRKGPLLCLMMHPLTEVSILQCS